MVGRGHGWLRYPNCYARLPYHCINTLFIFFSNITTLRYQIILPNPTNSRFIKHGENFSLNMKPICCTQTIYILEELSLFTYECDFARKAGNVKQHREIFIIIHPFHGTASGPTRILKVGSNGGFKESVGGQKIFELNEDQLLFLLSY